MLADGMLAVLVCLHTYTRVYHHGPFAGQAILLAGQLSLLLRQRAPGTVLATTTGSVVVFALLGGEVIPPRMRRFSTPDQLCRPPAITSGTVAAPHEIEMVSRRSDHSRRMLSFSMRR